MTATEPRLVVGSIIDGRYRIDAEAGSGGMAVVYRATHLKLGKRVALKVMSPTLAGNAEYRQFFEREARSASEIEHEHVVPVTDFGEDERGLYIVMRYIEGPNLREFLQRRGPLDPERAVQVTEDVAAALDAAHRRGFLHRDVKPANILIEESTGRIFLADFGLARAAVTDERTRTRSRVMGTDLYMAPERRRGEDTKLGDIYSLGCVLWEMLAGLASPLPGHSAEPPDDSVSPALRGVVERAVSPRPLDRFASAGDLAGAARSAIAPDASDTYPSEQRDRTATTGPYLRPQPFHEALSAGLSLQVIALCDETLGTLGRSVARHDIERIHKRLLEPLSLAVAGSPRAGKSTLINALLARRIAGTGFSRTAPLVTWFRHGRKERLEVVLRGGERLLATLTPDGQLPDELGASPEDVAAIEVWLPVEALRALTIVDTPGLTGADSGSEDVLALIGAAEETAAIQRADALLFVMAGDAQAADQEALAAFKRRFDGTGRASAVNSIGVLSKADVVALETDSWESAVGRASGLRAALGPLVSTVIPVAGRLAETASTNAITADVVHELAALARLDSGQRGRLLESDAAFREHPAPVPPGSREHILSLLGRFGIRRALELVNAETDPGALTSAAAAVHLREQSGIDDLRKRIDGLQLRADALKADAAMTELDTLSWKHHRELSALRDRIERLRLHGRDMHLLEVMRDFDRCASGEIELGEGMLEELEQLLTGSNAADRLGLALDAGPAEQRAAALERVRSWASYRSGGLASFRGEQVAGHVVRSYELLAEAV